MMLTLLFNERGIHVCWCTTFESASIWPLGDGRFPFDLFLSLYCVQRPHLFHSWLLSPFPMQVCGVMGHDIFISDI